MSGMSFKSILPRGIYGRAALILIVPIITIQIVLSVVFIQRHFERVTAQMTDNIVLDIRLITERVDAADDPVNALVELADYISTLQIGVGIHDASTAPLVQERRAWTDLAGREVIRVFRERLSGYLVSDLDHPDGRVHVWVQTRHGLLSVAIPRNRLTPSNPHQLLVIVFLASALMTAISFLFLRNQVRPIRRLAEVAEAYGRGEKLLYRPSGAREIRAAGRAFTDMRARIEQQNAQRLVMLSGVSHDMRTPLTRMRLTLSMMDENEDTKALTAEIDELQALLDSFLDFTRGQAGGEPEAVDPRALIEGLLTKYRNNCPDIAVAIAPDLPAQARLHPRLFERALDNLLGNAMRYGTRVSLHAERKSDWIEVAVEDDGPGIPQADRLRAREPFVRLDAARARNRKDGLHSGGAGVGLGLAIADDAMRAHEGALLLEQSAKLGGLRAVLRVPIQNL